MGRRPQAAPAHLRAHARRARRRRPPTSLFVGDTWGPDVDGPRAVGMRPLYLRRDGHWPDATAPDEPAAEDATVAPDLRGLLDLVRRLAESEPT